jgi:uncharacterized membrane protein YkoI
MRGIVGCLGASAVAGLLLLAAVAPAEDKDKKGAGKVDLDKVPKKVLDAVKARFPGAEITSASKETADGKVVWDIELKQKGRKYEMDIQEDGTVLEVEKELVGKEVPKAVLKALRAKYPKATIQVVMEVNLVKGKKEVPDHYEVTLETADKKTLEVVVSLDGKIGKGEGEGKKKE